MPELPEVETTVLDLNRFVGLYIRSIKLNRNNLRYPIPKNITIITKKSKIQSINRIGKYIIINLNNLFSLIIHLGMSGRIKSYEFKDLNYREKHDHVEIFLTKDKKITFNDPRRFGIFDIIKTEKIPNSKYFNKLGLDPFDKKFSKDYLHKKMCKSSASIKSLLLNQKIISGIGNIYACEILFDCKISPLKTGKNISNKQYLLLFKSIKKILKLAIKNKGSSLKDYKSIDGILGNYQNNFLVYNKKSIKMKRNNKIAKIIKINQGNRSTYYCPTIQK